MARFWKSAWRETDGVLSFEWTLLALLLVIGIVSGLAGARDAIIDEAGDVTEALLSIDNSYTFAGVDLTGDGDTNDPADIPPSSYADTPTPFADCDRYLGAPGILTMLDLDN